jgi:hypothetical protein
MISRLLKTSERRYLNKLKDQIQSGLIDVNRITKPGNIEGFKFSGPGVLIETFFVPTCFRMGCFALKSCELNVEQDDGVVDIDWITEKLHHWWSRQQ